MQYNLKGTKGIGRAVVRAYKAVEKGAVGAYKAVEKGVVGGYRKVENAFVSAFLEKAETPDEEPPKTQTKR